jgi:hypothetical protein
MDENNLTDEQKMLKLAEEARLKEEAEAAKNKPKDDEDKNNDLQKQIQEAVDQQLKDIKSKLDNAYAARDEALKKIAEAELQKQTEVKKKLEEEGKFKELYELQLAEMRAKQEALEQRNVELTRDVEVRSAMKSHQFRSDAANDMAFRTITEQLVQVDGVWKHKSGLSIAEFIGQFSQDEQYSFLFKQKQSSGGGTGGNQQPGAPDKGKTKLFDMKQEDVLKLAAEGKLGFIPTL